MRLILITFYKNMNDKMFTFVASENGAVWMNLLLFPLNWYLFASVLVPIVSPAFKYGPYQDWKVNWSPCTIASFAMLIQQNLYSASDYFPLLIYNILFLEYFKIISTIISVFQEQLNSKESLIKRENF